MRGPDVVDPLVRRLIELTGPKQVDRPRTPANPGVAPLRAPPARRQEGG